MDEVYCSTNYVLKTYEMCDSFIMHFYRQKDFSRLFLYMFAMLEVYHQINHVY
jgi:hypothetical protein